MSYPDPSLPSTPLRRWRLTSSLSYGELARRVGITRRAIMRLAAGGAPSAETAKAIRAVTGISLDELVGDALPPDQRQR